MLCYVVLCFVLLCYVMLCYVKLSYVVLCCAMLVYVMSCHVMLCYVMLCYVMWSADLPAGRCIWEQNESLRLWEGEKALDSCLRRPEGTWLLPYRRLERTWLLPSKASEAQVSCLSRVEDSRGPRAVRNLLSTTSPWRNQMWDPQRSKHTEKAPKPSKTNQSTYKNKHFFKTISIFLKKFIAWTAKLAHSTTLLTIRTA